MAHLLRLVENSLAGGAGWAGPLPAAHRVIYVAEGDVRLETGGAAVPLGADQARYVAGAVSVRAGERGAHVLRFELELQPAPTDAGGTVILEHPIDEEPGLERLMRCDRVDFGPGALALPHRHRGGGIRRLLRGALEVTVGQEEPRLMRPGDAWFESGRDPVRAVAAARGDTSFVRCSVLPAEIHGRSSILYVDPLDAGRTTPRTYTVYVDELIGALPS